LYKRQPARRFGSHPHSRIYIPLSPSLASARFLACSFKCVVSFIPPLNQRLTLRSFQVVLTRGLLHIHDTSPPFTPVVLSHTLPLSLVDIRTHTLDQRTHPPIQSSPTITFIAMSSLTATLPQAIAVLTNSLTARLHDATLLKLRNELQTSLFNHYVSTWDITRPLSGTGRRCLTFAPDAAPPRPIHAACVAARVPWAQWAAVLVEQEFDFFVDPGCVSARFGLSQDRQVLWSSTLGDLAHEKAAFAELLQAEDRAMEEDVFALLDDQIRSPQWTTPVVANFPTVPAPPRRSDSPESTYSTHSRTSSFSSLSSATSSSGASFSSVETIDSTLSGSPTQSRRERARQAQVYVDREKKEVTPYDGGKTTVLTGGVMLGAKAPARPMHQRSPSSASPTGRVGRF
jgi:hypothetical protein